MITFNTSEKGNVNAYTLKGRKWVKYQNGDLVSIKSLADNKSMILCFREPPWIHYLGEGSWFGGENKHVHKQ